MADKILVTAIEGAHMLSMGRSTFWRAVGAGMLPQPVRIGGLTRWRVADLIHAVDPASLPVSLPSSLHTSPSTTDAQRA